jgi:3-hydroxyacyl-CoA dehydrogenase
VAVLGAGVMGAQIAAHLVNVKVPVVLFDLPAKEGPKNGIVTRAIEGLKKLKPGAAGRARGRALIQPANYEEHLDLLKDCDLVIEAIAERMDWKLDLYKRIAPRWRRMRSSPATPRACRSPSCRGCPKRSSRASAASTSSTRRATCAGGADPTPATRPEVLDQLEAFVTSAVGKGVVRAKDTPNFIANRVGIAGMLATMKEAETFGLGYDVVDDLTGKKLGRAVSRAPSAPPTWWAWTRWRTSSRRCRTTWPTTRSSPATPRPGAGGKLIEKGALGQKTGAGFYKKVGKDILRLDPAKGEYVPAGGKADEIVGRMLKKPPAERLKLLRESSNPQAQFLWAILRDSFHYAAVHLEEIADNARDVDFAMRWGFGTSQGPFELWQHAGWKQVAQWVKADIEAGKALCKRAAAGLGVRRPRRRRAHARGLVEPGAGPTCRAAACRSTAASTSRRTSSARVPRRRCRPAPRSSRTTRCASGRSTARC